MVPTMELRGAIVAVDTTSWRTQIRQTVTECGLQPFMARSGGEMLDLARSMSAHLVILSMRMPDMSGLHACAHIRRLPDYVAIPIIILGRPDDRMEEAATTRAGANLLLTTPISIMQLRQGILPLVGEAPEEPSPQHVWPHPREPVPLFGEPLGLVHGRKVLNIVSPSLRTNYSR